MNFFSVDLILKDRDDVLISFSGFVQSKLLEKDIVAKKVNNYFEISGEDHDVFSLEYKADFYSFELIYFHNIKYQEILVYTLTLIVQSQMLHHLALK